jgi:hypothetical protein
VSRSTNGFLCFLTLALGTQGCLQGWVERDTTLPLPRLGLHIATWLGLSSLGLSGSSRHN